MKKYSKGFERDYKFYLENIEVFTFCGTKTPKHEAVSDKKGSTAKEAFYSIESEGKNKPCREPKKLNALLLCKASVNFQIKQWAEGRADGTLPKSEFSGTGGTLVWDKKTIKHRFSFLPSFIKARFNIKDKVSATSSCKESICKMYNAPQWVVCAVENQKEKILNQKKRP